MGGAPISQFIVQGITCLLDWSFRIQANIKLNVRFKLGLHFLDFTEREPRAEQLILGTYTKLAEVKVVPLLIVIWICTIPHYYYILFTSHYS
jgi:hypothetical protein